MNDKTNHCQGDVTAKPGEVYDYTSVGGYIDASGADTKTAFPRLQSVGGSISARGADTKTAFPRLQSVGDTIYARGADTKTAFPRLQSVGGSIYASGADTKTAFPRLQSVGGNIYAGGDYSHVETGNQTRCQAMLLASFERDRMSFADNVLARIVSTKGRVSRVILCGKTDVTYLVTDGNAWSHGVTLKAAREGLLFKISSRDTTEFKNWKLDRTISLRDSIRAYRAITGACEQGVRSWMENRKVPDSMTIRQAIELTRGAYRAEAFAAFFAK